MCIKRSQDFVSGVCVCVCEGRGWGGVCWLVVDLAWNYGYV